MTSLVGSSVPGTSLPESWVHLARGASTGYKQRGLAGSVSEGSQTGTRDALQARQEEFGRAQLEHRRQLQRPGLALALVSN